MATYGQLLGYWLVERDIKPAEFARQVEVSHTAVSQWLRDETAPREARRRKIERALDVTSAEFHAAASKLEQSGATDAN